MSSYSSPMIIYHDDVEGVPSTPQSGLIDQEAVVEVNYSSPIQVGVLQPSPQGTKYWVPEASNKPVEGKVFDTLELALKAYKAYAREAGFEVRKGGSWKTTAKKPDPDIKHFYCVRQGFKPASKPKKTDNDALGSALSVTKVIRKRKRASCRCGCTAGLRIRKTEDNKYRVYKFFEKHNHSLVNQDDIKYLRTSRRLTFSKHMLLNQLSNINIGPVRSWKVMKEMYGGFENIGATEVDCKNYKLGLNGFIGERDAQMVVDKLLSRQEFFNDFSVEYKLTKPDNELVGLFWADEQAKRNYEAFGDVVSFDATFRSNRYNMVLVPFIGVDNHNRCVIFAAALLSTESTKRYRWLLKRFRKVFVKVPKVVVTDQDPAMKIAIEQILPESRHRLCMWHIMQKLTTKVGATICSNTDFKRRLCNIVWTDKISADKFEAKWKLVMEDFGLVDNKWLQDMFEMRSKWIPAFFRHEPMSGLMRTTSRSESENHFFGQITNKHLSLIEFLSHFDTAMDSQRFKYGKNTHDSNYTTPDFKTHLEIEKEAAELYTQTVFYDVQDEIYASLMTCGSVSVATDGTCSIFIVRDTEADYKNKGVLVEVTFEVKYVSADCTINCSCLKYECFGLLCRHIFYVLRMSKVYKFPRQYLLRRWSKNVVPINIAATPVVVAGSSNPLSGVDGVVRGIYGHVEESVSRLVNDIQKLSLYNDDLASLLEKIKLNVPDIPELNKNETYAAALGVTEPTKVIIKTPTVVRNKGERSSKRLQSQAEIAMINSNRSPRFCRTCKTHGFHDSRNCPTKNDDTANNSAGKKPASDEAMDDSDYTPE